MVKYTKEDRDRIANVDSSGDVLYLLNTLVEMADVVGGPVMRKEHDHTTLLNTYFNALHTELGELSNELPTKPWNPNRPYDVKNALMELADVLAMLSNIIWIMTNRLGLPVSRMSEAYLEKLRINMDRIERQMK